MSDSEYYDEDCNEFPFAVEVKKPKKRAYSKRSDSEETVIVKEKQIKKPKPQTSKKSDSEETVVLKEQPIKKRKPQTSKRSSNKKVDAVDGVKSHSAYDVFGLVSKEEEEAAEEQQREDKLPTVLVSKVANGTISRRKLRDGEFYVEIKVYKTSDADSTRPEERWKKALTSLKMQMDPTATEWKQLQAFFETTRELMKDTKAVFFANKAF